jgi:hypothetical protein
VIPRLRSFLAVPLLISVYMPETSLKRLIVRSLQPMRAFRRHCIDYQLPTIN